MATPSALSPAASSAVIRIIDMRKHPSLETARAGKTDITISYMYGAEGPFTATIPYEEIGGKSVEEQNKAVLKYVKAAQAERLSFKGREIPVV
ncbi:MAG: hypothetical protein JRE40_04675 [Deltaproteobacteria bacterium]|nr:hypothetical protein [Deltaproteobacteria bacterium]